MHYWIDSMNVSRVRNLHNVIDNEPIETATITATLYGFEGTVVIPDITFTHHKDGDYYAKWNGSDLEQYKVYKMIVEIDVAGDILTVVECKSANYKRAGK